MLNGRRPWAWPLVPIYSTVVAVKWWMLRVGLLGTRKLRWPVVSVGSLSAGGAGKTPVVIALAKLLKDRGWEVDVLSRGYGREGTGVECVEASRDDAAQRYGDEPVMIAEQAKVPVWVGTNRYEAGTKAQEAAKSGWHGLHLLDDGFQHRQLARTLELVLVTNDDLNDALIPAGNLREGFDSLRRADAVVVREDEFEVAGKRLWEMVWAGTPIWTVRRRLVFPAAPKSANGNGSVSSTSDFNGRANGTNGNKDAAARAKGAGTRPIAFCAIARPDNFVKMLVGAGCDVVDSVAFDDHHQYSMTDIDQLLAAAAENEATGFVTTDKDAVKLTREMRSRLESVGTLMVVTLEVEFANTYEVMRAIESRLA
jgi:tetraacyldisaccharide 4'-kinase